MVILVGPARPYRGYLAVGGFMSLVFGALSLMYGDDVLFARPLVSATFIAAGVLSLASAVVWRLPLIQAAGAAALVACVMRAASFTAVWLDDPSWPIAGAVWLWVWITIMTVFVWGLVVVPRGLLHSLEVEEARHGSS